MRSSFSTERNRIVAYSSVNVVCSSQLIFTRPGHVLTMHFLQMKTDKNNSAIVEVYDGNSVAEKLLAKVRVKNGTLPQSVSSTRQNLYIKFYAEPRSNTLIFVRLTSGYSELLTIIFIRMNLASMIVQVELDSFDYNYRINH